MAASRSKPAGAAPADQRAEAHGYEILGVLGRGGMGVVYKARQKSLNRLTALKMILAGAHASAADLLRFRTEGEAVAKLQHPNIVQIYEVGEQDSHPYFSLEYVDGGSLQKKLDGTPLAVKDAAQLVEKLARAMHYAHQRGIVHRDLKPANVLLTSEGEPKITDFGLAKLVGDDSHQTGTGAILGTPSYMAPEQAQGRTKEVGPAADIYALGALLYDSLTGRPPFRGETVLETLQQVQTVDPVPPSRLRPRLPRDLETICLKCLHKEPRKRYLSAGALADDLQRFLADEPIRARPISLGERGIKWAKRRPAVAALLATLIVVITSAFGGMAYLWQQAEYERGVAEDERNEANDARQAAVTSQQLAEKESAAARIAEKEAMQAQREAQHRFDEAQRNLYAAHMNLAQTAWKEAKVSRLRELLERQYQSKVGGAPLKGFEWDYLHRLYQSDWLKIKSHGQLIMGIVFRPPQGQQLASASGDGTVILWDLTDENHPKYIIFAAHTGPVRGLAFTTDGQLLATAGEDGLIKLWDLRQGPDQKPRVFAGHKNWITSVAFSPDGARLASGSEDNSVKVWEVATGKVLQTLNGHTYGITALAFTSDGQRLASASFDRTVRVWDVATAKTIYAPLRHSHWVTSLIFSPHDQLLATASWDQVVTVWDALKGEVQQRLDKPGSPARTLAFSPDSQRLAAACLDQAVVVWDLTTAKVLRRLPPETGKVRSVTFSADGQLLASVNFNLLDQETETLNGHDALVGVAAARRGKHLAAACVDGSVLYWPSPNNESLQIFRGHKGPIRAIAFAPDGQQLASASEDGTVRLWHPAGGETKILQAHPRWVTCLAYTDDGKYLVTGSHDETIGIWDLATLTKVRTCKGHQGPVLGVACHPQGKWLASAGVDHTVRLWDLATAQEVTLLHHAKHVGPIRAVAFSPDGKLLASAGWDKEIKIWDLENGQVRATLTGHTHAITSVAFSPDGKRLASASDDRSVKVWDVTTGLETLSLKGHSQGVTGVAFHHDGAVLVSSSWDHTVMLWTAASPKK